MSFLKREEHTSDGMPSVKRAPKGIQMAGVANTRATALELRELNSRVERLEALHYREVAALERLVELLERR